MAGDVALVTAESIKVLFIFAVAVLNVCLGFAVAAYLGVRYRAFLAADAPQTGGPASPPAADRALAEPGWDDGLSAGDFGSGEAAAPPEPDFGEDLFEALGAASPPQREAEDAAADDAASAIDDAAPGEQDGVLDENASVDERDKPAAGDEETEDRSPEDAGGAAVSEKADFRAVTEPSDAESGSGASPITRFQGGVDHYQDQLTRVDDELRACAASADAAAIEACLDSLRAATDEYLRRRQDLRNDFQELPRTEDAFAAAADGVESAIRGQDERIESTRASIEAVDLRNEPVEGCQGVLRETGKLMEANHDLRDALDRALLGFAAQQQGFDAEAVAARSDRLTGVASREALEARLSQWWEKDPHRVRQLSVAMIDIDEFAKVNAAHGHRAGNRVLAAVGRLLEAERRGESTAARFAGQRFLFLFPDADLRHTANVAERIRQSLELTHFHYRDTDIRITVSCSATEAIAGDTTDTLLARAENTLREAKRYGRNRTFLHEGKFPAPVVPPSFSLEERQVNL